MASWGQTITQSTPLELRKIARTTQRQPYRSGSSRNRSLLIFLDKRVLAAQGSSIAQEMQNLGSNPSAHEKCERGFLFSVSRKSSHGKPPAVPISRKHHCARCFFYIFMLHPFRLSLISSLRQASRGVPLIPGPSRLDMVRPNLSLLITPNEALLCPMFSLSSPNLLNRRGERNIPVSMQCALFPRRCKALCCHRRDHEGKESLRW